MIIDPFDKENTVSTKIYNSMSHCNIYLT